MELTRGSSLALGAAELEFVEAAAAAEHRRKRVRRLIVQGVVVASLAIAAVMYFQYRVQKRARDLADSQVSRYLARQAGERRATELDLSLLLGVKAYRTSPTFEATSELLSALQATPRLVSFLPDAERTVRAVALDPAGRRLAFGGNDAILHVWDLASSKRVCQAALEGGKNWIRALAFAPAGDRLVSGSDDGGIRLWSAGDCSALGEVGRHEGAVSGLSFAANGTLVSAGADDRRLRIWAIEGGEGRELIEVPGSLLSVAASPDGALAAAGGLDGTIRIWKLATGEALDAVERSQSGAVSALAFSSAGRLLASAGAEGVRLWPLVADGERGTEAAPPAEVPEHQGAVISLAFSGDGRLLASGSQGGTLRVWDVADADRALKLDGAGTIYGLALDPEDPRRLVAARGEGGSVELWDVALRGDEDLLGLADPTSLAYGAGGLRLAVVDDGTVRFLDPVSGSPQGQPFPSSAAGENVGDIAFSSDGRYLATGGDDGTVRLWDPVTRQQWELPEGHEYAVRSLAFNGAGDLVAAGSEDMTVKVWSVADRTLLHTLAHEDWVNAVAFGAGDDLATAGDDGLLRLWNARTAEPLAEPRAADEESPFPPALTSLAYDPTGGQLAAAYGEDGAVLLWSRTGERLTEEPIVVDGRASAVAFSADGRLFAAAGGGSLHLYSMDRGAASALGMRPFATVGSDDGITALEFDPTRLVLAVVRSGSAELVDLTGIDAWAESACARANRNLTTTEWNELIGENVPYRDVCPGR